jgi:phage shock protein C
LRRTRDDRVIGGVCGGLGRYLGIDPVLMRIAFVILAFAGGGGILVYLVAWVLIPVERPGEDPAPPGPREPIRRGSSSAAR